MGERPRWLVATTEYAGLTPYTGGIGTHYAALLPALVRQGVGVDLVVFSDGPAIPAADLDGVRLLAYERTDRMPRAFALAHRALRVRRAYRHGDYDRVFLPEWIGLGAFLPVDAPLLTNLATGIRLAHEVSRLRLRDLPLADRPAVLLQRAMEARQIRRSAGVIAISQAMLAWTTSAFPRLPRAAVVRNCIDLDRVRAASTAAVPEGWPPGGDPIVLFLGRSERRKGVVDAVSAFGALHERMPHVRLVLAGAGGDARFEPTRADLLASLPATARPLVTWLGHVPGDRLFAAIRAASVAMCPSRWEGFGNVALEAKTIGTPLVVTTGSGFDDFCVDGVDCLMVPPAAPAPLAVALERLLTDRGLATALAEAAQERVGDFAPDPVAADLIAAADGLLDRG
ncbi:glycosyltransferase family 4 protein [Planococcus sp. APC 4015]|nr:glycosyltransferase family 4 protein [Planococcus sp. APC 4015]